MYMRYLKAMNRSRNRKLLKCTTYYTQCRQKNSRQDYDPHIRQAAGEDNSLSQDAKLTKGSGRLLTIFVVNAALQSGFSPFIRPSLGFLVRDILLV